MRREGKKHNIKSNATIRYGGTYKGKNIYSTRNRVQRTIRTCNGESCVEIKGGKTRYCLRCCGTRYTCGGFPYEINQWAKGYWKEGKTILNKYDIHNYDTNYEYDSFDECDIECEV